MAFSPQDIDALLGSAISNYIFNFAFESRNPGCKFDVDSWVNDLNKLNSDDLMIMSPEKQKELENFLSNLDKYAIKKDNLLGLE